MKSLADIIADIARVEPSSSANAVDLRDLVRSIMRDETFVEFSEHLFAECFAMVDASQHAALGGSIDPIPHYQATLTRLLQVAALLQLACRRHDACGPEDNPGRLALAAYGAASAVIGDPKAGLLIHKTLYNLERDAA